MAYFKKTASGAWQLRIEYNLNGERKTKSKSGFRTKKEAQIYAAELEKQLNRGNSLTAGNESFAKYFERWFETYRKGKFSWQSDKEVKYAITIAKKFFKDTKLRDIDRIMYQRFLNDYSSGRATATIKKVHTYTKMCLRDALNDGIIFKDPTYRAIIKGTKENKNKDLKFLNEADSDKLLNFIYSKLNPKHPSHYIILFALATGCRFSEILGLTWDCVDFEKGLITINKTWDYLKLHDFDKTKNDSSIRTINIDHRTLNILKHLRQDQKEWQLKSGARNKNNLIFVDKQFKPNSNNAVNKVLKNACAKLNIKEITIHALRHTHASILLYHNLNVKYVSRRLGHGDILTTLRTYGHILDELEQRESKQTNEIISAKYKSCFNL